MADHTTRREAAVSEGFTWHPEPQPMRLRGQPVMVLAQGGTLALIIDQEQWTLVEKAFLPMTSVGLTLVTNLQAS